MSYSQRLQTASPPSYLIPQLDRVSQTWWKWIQTLSPSLHCARPWTVAWTFTLLDPIWRGEEWLGIDSPEEWYFSGKQEQGFTISRKESLLSHVRSPYYAARWSCLSCWFSSPLRLNYYHEADQCQGRDSKKAWQACRTWRCSLELRVPQ